MFLVSVFFIIAKIPENFVVWHDLSTCFYALLSISSSTRRPLFHLHVNQFEACRAAYDYSTSRICPIELYGVQLRRQSRLMSQQ